MNSVKSILTSVLCLFILGLNAQSADQAEIRQKLDKFIELTNLKNYSEAFDMLYPKMFVTVGKQELIDLVNNEEKNGLSMILQNHKITGFSAPVVEGNETFVKVDYEAELLVNIAPGTMFDYPKAMIAMQQQFEQSYGVSNVKLDEDAKQFSIKANKSTMAIRPQGEGWYLAEINHDQPALMESLFPASVMKALVGSK